MTQKRASTANSPKKTRPRAPSKHSVPTAAKSTADAPSSVKHVLPKSANAATPPTSQSVTSAVFPDTGGRAPKTIPHNQILNALPHPVIVLAPDNGFVYANAAAEAFLSTSIAMLKRIRLDDVVPFGCPLLSLIGQVRRERTTVNEYGVDIVTPRQNSPKLVDVYGGISPHNPEHVLLMLQQRSMAQMIERQLTHRAAARSVSGMASILAHEIKNPLSGIRGAAQLLEPALSDEDRALSQLICTETDRIRMLLDRMEVFGDERPLSKEAVNIHDVLDHVRQLADAGFARNIHLIADYDPSLPAVPANRDKLVQAFLNLVKNAAESIGQDTENGRIVITTGYRPGVRLAVPGSGTRIALPLMIEVQDNGPGIPGTMREHMFDPFVTSKANGTGLGLALVAKLIADHGGTIECDSEPQRTVFRVLLPMQELPSNTKDPSKAI
jgi:two-component system, NtrC family, nitrogen regulation sensor histidine kinase GlnL